MNPYLSLVERRSEQRPIRVMFVGPDLSGVTKIFRRNDEPIEVEHTNSIAELMVLLESRSFDCVMVDQRRERESKGLSVATLVASKKVPHLIVMAAADTAETYHNIQGVDEVLEAPIAPQKIVQSIVSVSERTFEAQAEMEVHQPGEQPEEQTDEVSDEADEDDATNPEFHTSVSLAKEIDDGLWQTFLPLANFIYKKLAIIFLSALFLTFLFYGVMIVFFMGSTGWSLPFELSRGHELVIRAERDLGQMTVRRNQVRQALDQAKAGLENAVRKRHDAELILSISEKTVDLELAQQTTLAREAKSHIGRLKVVIKDFNQSNKRGVFAKDLATALSQTHDYQKITECGFPGSFGNPAPYGNHFQ